MNPSTHTHNLMFLLLSLLLLLLFLLLFSFPGMCEMSFVRDVSDIGETDVNTLPVLHTPSFITCRHPNVFSILVSFYAALDSSKKKTMAQI